MGDGKKIFWRRSGGMYWINLSLNGRERDFCGRSLEEALGLFLLESDEGKQLLKDFGFEIEEVKKGE